MFSVKRGNPLSLIMGAPYLDIVDTISTITLTKIKKTNHSNFTITQSRNIQMYLFETSLIQL